MMNLKKYSSVSQESSHKQSHLFNFDVKAEKNTKVK